MALIELDNSKCVRLLSKESECNKCETICPTSAIVVTENIPLPSINFSACVGCGGCGAVCPSEALSLDDFSATDFFFDFIDDKENLVSCKKNVPCIAALSVEHIISMAVLKKEVIFDVGHCGECEIKSTCHPQILKNCEEASYVLEAMESSASLKLEELCFEPEVKEETNRREFLGNMNLQGVAKTRNEFEKEVKKATDELIEHTASNSDISLLRQKRVPDKRKILFTAMKRVEKPSTYHVVDATELSFTSQKLMDESLCTACQMCYRVCPTGALTSDGKNSKIDFDPFLCIKCQICHDTCEPDAITLSSSYNMKEFFEPQVQNLVSFNVRRCDECNAVFSTNSDDTLCYRCKIEEEEARSLWGIE